MKPTEEQSVYNNLRKMGLTDEEAKEVISADKAIDKGEKLFELTEEQKQAEKKYKNTHTRTVKTAYGQTQTKEKKIDEVKIGLIELLTTVIAEQPACNSLTVVNTEREFNFLWGDKKYKIVLSCPRN